MSTQTPPTFANSNTCNNCECVLSFWRGNRRHHCRACGNSYCAECSGKSSIVPQFGIEEEVRVCDYCYNEIQTAINPPVTESPVRQSMFELDEEEAVGLAIAISKSEVESNVQPKPSKKRFLVNRSDSRSRTQCPKCLEERLEWALKTCGHVVCGECLADVDFCPICKKKPVGAIRIYISN